MEEADAKVQEKPATERSKAQLILVVAVVLLIIIFGVGLLNQLYGKSSDDEAVSNGSSLRWPK